jgi:ribonuclease BN (tRNA processing enzyme)
VIWPDFTVLPTKENPTLSIFSVEPEKQINVGGYQVTAVKVNHAFDAMGYIIDNGKCAVLFSGDTGPTDRIWEIAHGIKNLKAIFTEVSFPNRLQHIALISDHHTAETMSLEMAKMPSGVQVILTHMKPNYCDEVKREVKNLSDPRITVLEKDGLIFNF